MQPDIPSICIISRVHEINNFNAFTRLNRYDFTAPRSCKKRLPTISSGELQRTFACMERGIPCKADPNHHEMTVRFSLVGTTIASLGDGRSLDIITVWIAESRACARSVRAADTTQFADLPRSPHTESLVDMD